MLRRTRGMRLSLCLRAVGCLDLEHNNFGQHVAPGLRAQLRSLAEVPRPLHAVPYVSVSKKGCLCIWCLDLGQGLALVWDGGNAARAEVRRARGLPAWAACTGRLHCSLAQAPRV